MKSKIILVMFITGMTLIGIDAYPKIQSGHYLDFVGPDDFIIWGVLICMIAFVCIRASPSTLLGFIILFMICLMGDFRNMVDRNMRSGLENYRKEGHGSISGTWDLVQRDLHCCGVLNFTDWSGVGNFSEGQTPDSCCKKVPEVVGCGLSTDAATKNAGGCLKEFKFLDYIDIACIVVKVLVGIWITHGTLVIGVFCIRKMCGQKPDPKDYFV